VAILFFAHGMEYTGINPLLLAFLSGWGDASMDVISLN
jgi:hypothetical protein